MTITHNLIKKGFIAAGIMNGSVLLFSKMFTNQAINEADPAVMSNFGLVMIVLWGLAYISVAHTYQHVKWLVAVFAIEKLCYGVNWINWLINNSLLDLYENDTFAGAFFSLYGVNDWLFCLFFLFVFFRIFILKKIKTSHEK